MSGKRQKTQYSLALESVARGETPVSDHQGAEPFVAKPAPESPALQANPIEPPRYVTRMPGGVGGVAPRGVPLSRSIPFLLGGAIGVPIGVELLSWTSLATLRLSGGSVLILFGLSSLVRTQGEPRT